MNTKAYSYIRFSSKIQMQGDSQRRQLEATKRYCEEKGLELVEDMRDLGLSAYHGKHRFGALGEFLKLVEKGKIEKGSILIVENLDRLSREKVLDALNQFTSIIQAGVKIVTLHDRQEYDLRSINNNWTQLVISITYMARAHEESKVKSERIKSTLNNKRDRVRKGEVKFTGNTPAWLKLAPNKKEFIKIPEVCRAIETIYQMKLNGKSVQKIEKELNQRANIWKPPITMRNKTGGWRKSYINKLLHNNRQLIGEFQPHMLKNGKRVPEGLPIKKYFPKIIDEELFFQVQKQIEDNSKIIGNGGGKTGRARSLFTHIIKCGLCGAPLHFIDKGRPPKGGQYLHCDASRRKLDNGKRCQARPIRYNKFEKVFFDTINELNLDEIFGQENEQQIIINDKKQQLENVEYKIAEINKSEKNLTKAVAETGNDTVRQMFVKQIERITLEQDLLKNEEKKLKKDILQLSATKESVKRTINATKNYFEALNEPKNRNNAELRLQIRREIRKLISEIRVIPYLDKKEALKIFKPEYDKFMEEYNRNKNKSKLKVRLHSYKKRMTKLKKDETNDRIYYGQSYITWNNQVSSKGTAFTLPLPGNSRIKHLQPGF